MKVLMFGWEFPPHISGGLGTACAGLTRALEKEHVEILFVVPKLHGGEQADRTAFLNASTIPIRQKKITPLGNNPAESSHVTAEQQKGSSKHRAEAFPASHSTIEVPIDLSPYATTTDSQSAVGLRHWNYTFSEFRDRTLPASLRTETPWSRKPGGYVKKPYPFSGSYGANLFEEVERYAQVAAEIAKQNSFDVIHAHDWMTFRAGIAAKKISGKPLILHVHATEIDRSGAHVNPQVFAIEKEGMAQADKVVTVSYWTKQIAVEHYQIDEAKIEVVHNGITPRESIALASPASAIGAPIITFLGRITHQKGPMYFVEAARKVHEKFPDAHFVVAGSGDQLPGMIERIAQLRLSKNFHFTGFLRGQDVDRIWSMSNLYVMPSVSEPFGIAPLEAIQAGVPVIISKQTGVSEVMQHAIKVDFWNTDALAEAICNVLRYKSLANTLKKNSSEQVKDITWDKAAKKLTTLYYELSNKHERPERPDPVLSGSPTKKIVQPAVF